MPRPLRTFPGVLLVLWIGACSENLGPAPPDGGRAVGVRAEGAVGPRAERIATALAVGGTTSLVGTDGGVYGFDGGAPDDWWAVHGGYLTSADEARVGAVADLCASRDGSLILLRGELGPTDALVASTDGGRFFDRLDRPDALSTSVDGVGLAPAGALGPRGAWLAVQGGAVYVRALEAADWFAVLLPRAPARFDAIAADADGRIALVVAARTSDDHRVWTRAGPGSNFAETGPVLDGPGLALAWFEGQSYVVTRSGIHSGGVRSVEWPGMEIERAALDGSGPRLRWALVGRAPDSSLWLATGSGEGAVVDAASLPDEPVVAAALGPTGALVLHRDGAISDGTGTHPFRGVETDLTALATERSSRTLAVAHARSAEVYQGPISGSGSFRPRGTPLRASLPRALEFEPGVPDALFLASFGVYRGVPGGPSWESRNQGFMSFDPTIFGGPFPVSSLVILPNGEYWVGGTNGDGPYRSPDAGLSWERVHAGLGVPGSYGTEPGLPRITQVTGFALDGTGALWMTGFRGGAFRLDRDALVWSSRSEGLPRAADGRPLRGCCAVPGEDEVDVRSLVTTGDGSLLAATGWGVYRLPSTGGSWVEWSTGLFVRDVRRLLVHPHDPSTVVAAVWPIRESPAPLYLTEDGGRTWFPVASRISGRRIRDLDWGDPARMELVVALEAQGAWRLELDP